MPQRIWSVHLGVALCSLIAVFGVQVSAVAAQEARTVYAGVLDKDGQPVLDLQAADFEVKEGGKTVEITSVKLAAKPVRIALLVSDRGTGQFQPGALRFCEAILSRGEVAITGITTQPERFSDFSNSTDVLRDGLLKIGRRATASSASGAQLVEAILESTKDIAREGYRPIIVVMRNGGEGPTPLRAEAVRDALRRSGAALFTVSTTGTQGVTGGGAPMTAAAMSEAAARAEVQEGMLTLATILGDGAKDTGGNHQQVISTTLIPTMQKLAAELINQYEITYSLPAGVKASDRLSVAAKRRGLVVHAPTRLAE